MTNQRDDVSNSRKAKATTGGAPADVIAQYERDRKRQGLPSRITDPQICQRVADILSGIGSDRTQGTK